MFSRVKSERTKGIDMNGTVRYVMSLSESSSASRLPKLGRLPR